MRMSIRGAVVCALLLGSLLLLPSCGGEDHSSVAEERGVGKALQFEAQEQSWREEGCAEGADCATVAFHYPLLVEGPDDVKTSVNAFVLGEILRPATGEGPVLSPESLARDFLEGYGTFKDDSPSSAQIWTLDRKVEVVAAPEGIVSLRATSHMYSGGAHGLSTTTLASFDAKNGQRLGVPDLLVYGFREDLTAIAEQAFRAARDIATDADLAEAGFRFEGESFYLSENVAVTKDGLLFYFNPYEIAAHALGPTEFSLTREEIAALVDPDGLLASWGAEKETDE